MGGGSLYGLEDGFLLKIDPVPGQLAQILNQFYLGPAILRHVGGGFFQLFSVHIT